MSLFFSCTAFERWQLHLTVLDIDACVVLPQLKLYSSLFGCTGLAAVTGQIT